MTSRPVVAVGAAVLADLALPAITAVLMVILVAGAAPMLQHIAPLAIVAAVVLADLALPAIRAVLTVTLVAVAAPMLLVPLRRGAARTVPVPGLLPPVRELPELPTRTSWRPQHRTLAERRLRLAKAHNFRHRVCSHLYRF